MYTLYLHITPNDKCYVGITSMEVRSRWGNEGRRYKSQYFYRAIKKYGWNNILHIIIAQNLSKYEATTLEQQFIKVLNSNNPQDGYNLTEGGEGSNGILITESTREKLRIRSKGEKNPFYMKIHTDKTKQIISEKNKGKFVGGKSKLSKKVYCITTGFTYNSITEASIDLKINRVMISNVCKGKSISSGGYKFCYLEEKDNPKLKQRTDTRWKKVMCIETNSIYKSITDASNHIGIDGHGISDCCKGKQKTAGGYTWRYL